MEDHTLLGKKVVRHIWIRGPGAFIILKALAFSQRGENKDAYDLYYVLRYFGNDVKDVVTCFRPLLHHEDTRKAIKILEDALKLSAGDDKSTLFLLAKAYQNLEEYSKAAEIYNRLTFMEPAKDKVFYNLGLIYGKEDRLGLAHYNFGIYFKRLKNMKEAMFHFQKAEKMAFDDTALQDKICIHRNEKIISISAEKRENIDGLTDLLLQIVNAGSIKHQDVLISNIRHYNALSSASEALTRVSEGLTSSLPSDLLAQDIREALHYLGEITGEVTTDEILGNIFRNFCIGK